MKHTKIVSIQQWVYQYAGRLPRYRWIQTQFVLFLVAALLLWMVVGRAQVESILLIRALESAVTELTHRRSQLQAHLEHSLARASRSNGPMSVDDDSLADRAQTALVYIYKTSGLAAVEISRLTADSKCSFNEELGYSVRFVGRYAGIADVVTKMTERECDWVITKFHFLPRTSRADDRVIDVETCIVFVPNL